MFPVGPLMDEVVEQLNEVMGLCKSFVQRLMNQQLS